MARRAPSPQKGRWAQTAAFKRPWLLCSAAVVLVGCNVILGYEEGTLPPADGGATTGIGTGAGTSEGGGGTGAGTAGATPTGTGTPTGSGGGAPTGLPTGTGTGTGVGGSGGTAGSGGSGGDPVTCSAQYSGIGAGSVICNQTATDCDVEVDVTGWSCTEACQAGGGQCLHASCKVTSAQCDACAFGIACGIDSGVNICTCSRGCGTGPPCVSPQICNSGTCS